MGLSLRGQTSGAVDINAPAVAGDNTITLPGGNGSANQFYKNSDTAGIITHSSMTESSSGVISIGDIDIDGTTRTITTGVGQTVGFSTDIEVQGSVSISSGNLVLASGSGIDFSATADGTGATNVNELFDDYEEGEFTPVFRGSTTAGTYTGTFNGFYTKIGNLVSIDIQMSNITASAAGSGNLEIAGLPFVSATGVASQGAIRYDSFNVNDTADGLVPVISNNSDSMLIFEVGDDRGDSSTNVGDITSGATDIFISIVYRV